MAKPHLGIKKNTDSFLKSLIKFKKDIGRKIFLLMDRAPRHKSKKAREFFQKNKYWLQILLFPPATPDLTFRRCLQKKNIFYAIVFR